MTKSCGFIPETWTYYKNKVKDKAYLGDKTTLEID